MLACAGRAQTNSPPAGAQWFVVPIPHLRVISDEPAKPERNSPKVLPETAPIKPGPGASESAATNSRLTGLLTASTDSQDTYPFRKYPALVPKQALEPVSRNWVADGVDSIFHPEEFRVGRTTKVSCTIATAIKRKDPLCLLYPVFFRFSW
jgi:hypothetical protein